MSPRKRDDPHEGFLYRVVCRPWGSDEEWLHTSYGHYGNPRTYMTLGAARGMKTRMESANKQATSYINSRNTALEFRVERAPVENWEAVPD